ncbi:MAG: MFS transporter, partial [Candidatus Nanopelagicaceae bacterium]
MNSSSPNRWLWALLVNVAMAQASIYVMRPMITYRALENGASTYEIGLIASIYALTPLLIAVSMGRWVGKFGEVPLLILGSISFILLALSLSFTNNILVIAAMTAIAGIAHLANVAASQSMVASKSPNHLQDQNFGYFSFSTSLGHTVGPMLGGLIAGSAGVLPESSSSAFIFAALLAFLSLVPFFLFKSIKEVRTQQERDAAGSVKARDVLSRPGIKPAIWTSLSVAAANDVLVVILPLVGTEKGISPVVIGAILSIRSAAAMISRFLLGRLTKIYGSARTMNYSIFLSALFLFASIYANSSIALGLSMAIVGFLLGIGQPLTMSIVSKKTPVEERAMAISIRLFGNRVGQFLVPLAAGALAAPFGASSVFIGLGVLVASAGVISTATLNDQT